MTRIIRYIKFSNSSNFCSYPREYGSTSGVLSQNNTTNLDGVSVYPYSGAIERIYKAPKISQNLNVYWNGVNGNLQHMGQMISHLKEVKQ